MLSYLSSNTATALNPISLHQLYITLFAIPATIPISTLFALFVITITLISIRLSPLKRMLRGKLTQL